MVQETSAKDVENDDLICPITMEYFHDPVIAKDGYVYEREAITKWISEHGTSPFTREPLQMHDLRPDVRLKRLAAQRRNSTVSYNAKENSVTLPPVRRVSENKRRSTSIAVPNSRETNHQPKKCAPRTIPLIISGIIILVFVVLTIVFTTKALTTSDISSSASSKMNKTSTYSNSLTTNSSMFIRPRTNTSEYYYEAIQVIVPTNGAYAFKSASNMDMYGYLYSKYFNATNPWANQIAYDDDHGGNHQFYFKTYLYSNNYTLVVTTFPANVTGSFSIFVTGSDYVTFQKL